MEGVTHDTAAKTARKLRRKGILLAAVWTPGHEEEYVPMQVQHDDELMILYIGDQTFAVRRVDYEALP